MTGPKVGFLVEGDDRTGVMADLYAKLAAARINITASDAVIAGAGRFGAILGQGPRREPTAKALGSS